MSPSNGTLVTSSRSVCSKMPPITTVPPFSTSTCGLDVLGVDREAGGRGAADAVLGDVDVEDDVAFGRDLRRHLELQVGLAELQRGGAAGGRHLVGQFLALLDQRLHLVGGDDARARHDLALAVGLERRDLQVQEAVGRRAEQRQREGRRRRSRSAPVAGRLTKLRVGEVDAAVPLCRSARRPRCSCRRSRRGCCRRC